MADTTTTNLNLIKPELGEAEDTWGISLNSDLDTLDAIFSTTGTQINLNPNQINFADGKKAIFGSNDLEIYSDGTHSYIEEKNASGNFYIKAESFNVGRQANSELYITAQPNDAVKLHYDNSEKLSTATDGIDIKGITNTTFGLNIIDPSASAYGAHFSFDDTNTKVLIGGVTNGTKNTAISIPRDSTQVDFASNITLPDNASIKLGADSDLQLFHDGGNSFIREAGTGNLYIEGAGSIRFRGTTTQENLIEAVENGAVSLYHNNSVKIATSSAGVDISGTVTADGLTVDGSSTGTLNIVNFLNTDTSANQTANRLGLGISNSAGANYTYIEAKETGVDAFAEMNFYTGSTSLKRLTLGDGGDVSFYEDTGTTAKMFWDASAESLGIGTTSPARNLTVHGGSGNSIFALQNDSTGSASGDGFQIQLVGKDIYQYNYDDGFMAFGTNNAESLRLISNGNFGIGTSLPSEKLEVAGKIKTGGQVRVGSYLEGFPSFSFANDTDTGMFSDTDNQLEFSTGGSSRLSIDSSGRVGIGTASMGAPLHITNATPVLRFTDSDTSRNSQIVGVDGNLRFDADNDNQQSSTNISFRTDGTETARFTDGNLLVGTTSTNPQSSSSTEGVQIAPDHIGVGRNANTSLYLNRQSDDGDIISFRKDGSAVGSIGVNGGRLNIGSDDTHIFFDSGDSPSIRPHNGSSATDGVIDIGESGTRFKDLHLSGTAYTSGITTPSGNFTLDAGGDITLDADGGDIIFADGGTEFGSVGNSSGSMFIEGLPASGKVGLTFFGSSIEPRDAGSSSNGAVDLGATGSKFKDLHLSGTANVGGLNTEIPDNNSSPVTIQQGGNSYFKIVTTNSSESVQIGNSTTKPNVLLGQGNTGIGTTSPNAPLSVVSASNANTIRMYGRSADNYSELYASSHDGGTNYAFLQGHSSQTKLATLGSTPLILGTNGTERLQIDASGSLLFNGNGVVSVQSNSSNFYLGGGSYSPSELHLESGSFTASKVNGSEQMRLTSTGLAIGTTDVKTTLTVLNPTAPTFNNDTHAGESIFIRSGGSAGSGNAQAVLAFGKADSSALRSGSAIASVQTDSDVDKIGLGFYTSDGSASAQTLDQRMLLTHIGNLGIGISPSEKLHVDGNILATGNITAYSDERLKENIKTLDGSKVLEMRGVSYTKDGKASSGVIAQELEKIAPELVHTAKDEMATKSVAYGNLIGYLIEGMKEQQKQIENLQQQITNLGG